MSDDVHRRIAAKQAAFDRGEFRIPEHGIERFEFHGCRCNECCAAKQRVNELTLRLSEEMHDHPGRLQRGLVAPVDAAHSRELEDVEPADWRDTP